MKLFDSLIMSTQVFKKERAKAVSWYELAGQLRTKLEVEQQTSALLARHNEGLRAELYETKCKLNLAEQREWNRTVKPDVYPDPASIKVSFESETRDVLTLCASVRITRDVMQGFSRKNALALAARTLAENLVKAIMEEVRA